MKLTLTIKSNPEVKDEIPWIGKFNWQKAAVLRLKFPFGRSESALLEPPLQQKNNFKSHEITVTVKSI